jgi:hypothetical protein
VSGAVTDSATGELLTGAKVSFVAGVVGDGGAPSSADGGSTVVTLTTDASGGYAADLPIGAYSVTVSAAGFKTATVNVNLTAGASVTNSVALVPTSAVAANAGSDQTVAPGGSVTLSGAAAVYDGSTGTTYAWTQVSGPAVTITGGDTATPTVTVSDKATLIANLATLLNAINRTKVAGVNPFALEEAQIAVLKLTVATSSGSYTDTVNVTTDLGVAVSPGINNVPIGVPVLLQAKENTAGYAWTLTPPAGSTAALDAPTTRWPSFTPDLTGTYTATETVSTVSLTITAGLWAGAITGLDPTDGLPLAANCTGCHNGTFAPDKFTTWRTSGHAQIFSKNVDDPANHWSVSGCGSCHTVGYNPSASNGGFDDAARTEGWTQPKGAPDVYAKMFATDPAPTTLETAKRANIQCENCHGPNGPPSHMNGSSTRVSLSSEVCGSCHGEPLRHGRYQQWEQSLHGDYDLPQEEATVEARGATAAHCGRCHSAQGFLAWIKQGDLTKYIQGTAGNATVEELTALGLTAGTVLPTTCATCHDPHNEGNASGDPNKAKVRVSDNTGMLPAGFSATGVGKGALCMTCHNTRNGAHNDTVAAPSSFSGPHAPAQGDVLMGQNAYFVTPGQRSKHSYIADTCVNCHLRQSPPPADLSYQQSGTNHTFAADPTICSNCHGAFDGGSLQAVMQQNLTTLGTAIAAAAKAKLNAVGIIHVRAYDPITKLYSSTADTDSNVTIDLTANPATTVTLSGSNLLVTLTSPVSITWTDTTTTSVSQIRLGLAALKNDAAGAVGTNVFPTSSSLWKAIWNLTLLTNDSSLGVHNPSFYNDVITNTLAKDLTL